MDPGVDVGRKAWGGSIRLRARGRQNAEHTRCVTQSKPGGPTVRLDRKLDRAGSDQTRLGHQRGKGCLLQQTLRIGNAITSDVYLHPSKVSCVALDKCLDLSEPQFFSSVKWRSSCRLGRVPVKMEDSEPDKTVVASVLKGFPPPASRTMRVGLSSPITRMHAHLKFLTMHSIEFGTN